MYFEFKAQCKSRIRQAGGGGGGDKERGSLLPVGIVTPLSDLEGLDHPEYTP